MDHNIMGNGVLENGFSLKSPNQKLLAIYTNGTIIIKELPTHKILYTFNDVFPALTLKWALNSKTLAIIQHAVGGSQFTVIYDKNNIWDSNTFDQELDTSSVIRLDPLNDGFKVLIVGISRSERADPTPRSQYEREYLKISFIYNTSASFLEKHEVTNIDKKAYEELINTKQL